MGLPFAFMAALMSGVMIASGFIRAEKGEDFGEEVG